MKKLADIRKASTDDIYYVSAAAVVQFLVDPHLPGPNLEYAFGNQVRLTKSISLPPLAGKDRYFRCDKSGRLLISGVAVSHLTQLL